MISRDPRHDARFFFGPKASAQGPCCKETVVARVGRSAEERRCPRGATRDGYCAQHHPEHIDARRAKAVAGASP